MLSASSLLQTFQAKGLVSNKLYVSNHTGLRGVFALVEIDAGELLMQIPYRVTLPPDESVITTMTKRGWPPQLNSSTSAQRLVALAASLLFLNTDPVDDALAAWKASLPHECPYGSLFGVDDVGATLFGSVWSKHGYMIVRSGVLASLELLFPYHSLAERKWAACMAMSRAFTDPVYVVSISPALDFINHSPPEYQNIEVMYSNETSFSGRAVRSLRRFLPGEELLFSYDDKKEIGMSAFQWVYGFVPPAHSVILFRWRLTSDARKISEATWAELGCAGLEEGVVFLADIEQQPSDVITPAFERFRCARLWHYSDADGHAAHVAGHLSKYRSRTCRYEVGWLVADLLALTALLKLCKSELLVPQKTARLQQLRVEIESRFAWPKVLEVFDRETRAMRSWCSHMHSMWKTSHDILLELLGQSRTPRFKRASSLSLNQADQAPHDATVVKRILAL